MSLYNGPVRGGNRGGKDQFNWDSVKADKDREFYLGHSVKATTGRWQKGKDVFWYTREKGDANNPIAAELRGVKEREEELMMEALGVKPKVKKLPVQPKLDTRELTQLTGKAEEEELDAAAQADRVKGLGYQPNQSDGHAAGHEVMAGTAGSEVERLPPPPAGKPPASAIVGHKRGLEADEKALHKAGKKAAKRAKKEAKKEKKAAKKKAKKAAARQDSSSSDSLSDDDAAPSTHKRQADGAAAAPLHGEDRHNGDSGWQQRPADRATGQGRERNDGAYPSRDRGRWQDGSGRQQRHDISPPRHRQCSVSPPRRRDRSTSPPRQRSDHRAGQHDQHGRDAPHVRAR